MADHFTMAEDNTFSQDSLTLAAEGKPEYDCQDKLEKSKDAGKSVERKQSGMS